MPSYCVLNCDFSKGGAETDDVSFLDELRTDNWTDEGAISDSRLLRPEHSIPDYLLLYYNIAIVTEREIHLPLEQPRKFPLVLPQTLQCLHPQRRSPTAPASSVHMIGEHLKHIFSIYNISFLVCVGLARSFVAIFLSPSIVVEGFLPSTCFWFLLILTLSIFIGFINVNKNRRI